MKKNSLVILFISWCSFFVIENKGLSTSDVMENLQDHMRPLGEPIEIRIVDVKDVIFKYAKKPANRIQLDEVFKKLADINNGTLNIVDDFFGNTPLMWSIANCNLKATNALIQVAKQFGIDIGVNVFDKAKRNNPLILATVKGGCKVKEISSSRVYEEVISFSDTIANLLEIGANPQSTNPEGFSALFFAIIRRDPQITEILAKSGAILTDRETNILNKVSTNQPMVFSILGRQSEARLPISFSDMPPGF